MLWARITALLTRRLLNGGNKEFAFGLYTKESHSLNTYDSSPSLITNESSQSSLKLDFRLFRLPAAVGFLRPFSEPDLPSGILDF